MASDGKKGKKGKIKSLSKSSKIRSKSVPVEKIRKIFDLYLKEVPMKKISEDLGLSFATLKKYIEYGDESRGIEPLKERKKRVIKVAMDLDDQGIMRQLHSTVKLSSDGMDVSCRRLLQRYNASIALDDPGSIPEGKEETFEKIALEPSLKSLETFHRLQMDALDRVLKVKTPDVTSPNVSVNVHQNQAQKQDQGQNTNTGDISIDKAYQHLDALLEHSITGDARVIEGVVSDACLEAENAERLKDDSEDDLDAVNLIASFD